MEFIYITSARMPTEKAHGIQIMKMCSAFSNLERDNEKIEVELIIPKRRNHIKQDLFDYYGIKKNHALCLGDT